MGIPQLSLGLASPARVVRECISLECTCFIAILFGSPSPYFSFNAGQFALSPGNHGLFS